MSENDEPGWEDPCDFCTQSTAAKPKSDWVACDICKRWCHDVCVGIDGDPNAEFSSWHCPLCEKDHGPSIPRRASSRKRAAIDYAALDRGEPLKSAHIFISRFENFEYATLTACDVPDIDTAESEGINQPLIVREPKYDQLEMRVPDGLSVSRIADLVGEDTPLEVIDVQTQNGLVGWDLAAWRDYFEKSKRDKIRNVISLEVSGTPLGAAIKRPKLVQQLDLVSKVWPSNGEEDPPKVSLYCLMSVAGSYTDFHVDFAGSSVFYHVCSGAKTFLLIPPTDTNLNKYEKWCNSIDQSDTFFADMVKTCYRVDLEAGDSVIIPSGWIHAVHTPHDSVVIGGNFLTAINLETQLKIAAIEKRTKVPKKFRFPKLDKVLHYSAQHYAQMESPPHSALELNGVLALNNYIANPRLDEKVKEWDLPSVKREADANTNGNGSMKKSKRS